MLSHDLQALTLDFLAGQEFGVRLLSVGEEGGDREDSAKLVGTAPEAPLEPMDDVGKGCADEEIVVDVLGNDSGPDGNSLMIAAVNGMAIAEGETIEASDGVFISLTGGKLIFDGEDAFAFLDIGEKTTTEYTYTVTDGNGRFADATVTITFCGDANSVASLCDSLPDDLVSYQIRTEYEAPFDDYGFDLKITASTDARFDGVTYAEAYCLSILDPADGAESFADAPIFTGRLTCSTDPGAGAVFGPAQIGFSNGLAAAENLDLINWILNQDFESNGFSGVEVQRAIWELTDSFDTAYLDAIDPALGDDTNVNFIVAEAIANGEGYMPGVGDKLGVILDPDPATTENAQPFLIAIEFEHYDCLC